MCIHMQCQLSRTHSELISHYWTQNMLHFPWQRAMTPDQCTFQSRIEGQFQGSSYSKFQNQSNYRIVNLSKFICWISSSDVFINGSFGISLRNIYVEMQSTHGVRPPCLFCCCYSWCVNSSCYFVSFNFDFMIKQNHQESVWGPWGLIVYRELFIPVTIMICLSLTELCFLFPHETGSLLAVIVTSLFLVIDKNFSLLPG